MFSSLSLPQREQTNYQINQMTAHKQEE